MKVVATKLPEVKLVMPTVFRDERGFVFESWNARICAAEGVGPSFVQDNHSHSVKGALRGLHYQIDQSQGKLVRAVAGRAYVVAADIRRSSPRFTQWVGYTLTAGNQRQLWVPPGFAHAFLALDDETQVLYKCTDFYAPQFERVILWSDPTLAITWPLANLEPVLSRKDAAAPPLAAAEIYE